MRAARPSLSRAVSWLYASFLTRLSSRPHCGAARARPIKQQTRRFRGPSGPSHDLSRSRDDAMMTTLIPDREALRHDQAAAVGARAESELLAARQGRGE